ncbi:hypothetical protein [Flavobacterium litorale]|uniref:YD repeat-containing protein n=1 Tax=Flavobacterium litorale TaxID=2856519 RepID=A0ABX8V621_9FLAO|nr:hypothetical protein [Flavobacterium litorale]QYJ68280.1 hypothetical protein K1I41_12260 [Flavobacterium litorale]
MKKPIFTFLLQCLLLCGFTLYSQTEAPQSPSVSGLMVYGSNPVDLYTGIPNISFPLYSMPTRSKDISINLSLSYHPLSVAVFREKEGNCGRGWTLSKGGTVSFDDGKSRKWKSLYDSLHDDDTNAPVNPSGLPVSGNFNFMGYSGGFTVEMDLTNYELKGKVSENDSEIVEMKVVYIPSTYKIRAFIFYDIKGYAYVFSIKDTYVNVFTEELDEINPYTGEPEEIERRINTPSAYHMSHIYDTNALNFDPFLNFTVSSPTPGEPLAVFNYTDLPNQLSYHDTDEGEANHIKMLSSINVPGVGSVTFSGNHVGQNTPVMTYTYSSMYVTNAFGQYIKGYAFTTELLTDQLAGSTPNIRLKSFTEGPSGDKYTFSYHYTGPSLDGYSWNNYGYVNASLISDFSQFKSNNLAKQGVLQKVTLPTGGCVIYDYELNTYSFKNGKRIDCVGGDSNTRGNIDENFFENDSSDFNDHNQNQDPFNPTPIKKWYKGPGIRIKSIAHFVTDDVPKEYYDDDLSSQYIPIKEINYDYTLPDEPDMSSGSLTMNHWPSRSNYNYSLSSLVKSSNSPVVYSNVRVTSTADNGGYIDHSFITNNEVEDCLTPHEAADARKPSYKIGKLLNKKVYNSEDVLQQETTYTYDFNEIGTIGDGQSSFGYELGWAGITKVDKKFYHPSGMVNTIDNYTYYPNRKIKTHTFTDSKGDELTTKYYYHELNSDSNFKNRIQPESVEEYRNSELLSISRINHNNNWINSQGNLINNSYLPSSTQVAKGNDAFTITVHFDRYDEYGHLLEFTQEDGLKVAYIWGYQDSQIIAKIEGINSYSDIDSTLLSTIKSESDTGTEAQLLTELDNLRNLPALADTVITTYTHIPLVGVSTITDARKRRTTYIYDTENRLKQVVDHEGNILSENEYHNKMQN